MTAAATLKTIISENLTPVPNLLHSLDLSTTISPFTYVRSNSAWRFDSSGVITSVSANIPPAPAYWWNGTSWENRGISIFNSRTNSLLNSTVPATQTRSIASGTYILWLYPSDTGSVTVSGGPTGTATASTPLIFSISSTTSVTFTKTGTVTFFQCERTAAAGTTNVPLSTPIVTAGATVTRSAPTITANCVSDLGLSPARGTVVLSLLIPQRHSSNQLIFQLDSGSNTNCFEVYYSIAGRYAASIVTSGVITQTCNVTETVFPAKKTIGVAWDETGFTLSVDGNTSSVSATINTSAFTTFRLGHSAVAGQELNGYISSIQIYDDRFDDVTLKSLTIGPSTVITSGNVYVIGSTGQSNCFGSYGRPIQSSSPPYPSQLYMLNDAWGTYGSGNISPYSAYDRPTDYEAAYERPIPVSPVTGTSVCTGSGIDANCGESPLTSTGAELIYEGVTNPIILRGGAAPGKTISEINKNTTPYNSLMSSFSTIYAQMRATGVESCKLKAIIVDHGQTDAANSWDSDGNYISGSLENFDSLWDQNIDDLVNDSKTIFNQSESPTIFACVNSANGSGEFSTHYPTSSVWEQWCDASRANMRIVMPSYFSDLNVNHGPHHTGQAQLLRGEYYGRAIKAELDSTTWKPFHKTSCAFKSGDRFIIEVVCHVPDGSIVFDTTTINSAPFYGFKYQDDEGVIEITSVTKSGSTISIHLSSVVPSGINPILSYAAIGHYRAHDTNLPTIVSGGTGYPNGQIVITANYNPSKVATSFIGGYSQARYLATVSGNTVVSIDSVYDYGGYPDSDAGTKNNVTTVNPTTSDGSDTPVSGSGLVISNLNIRRGYASNIRSGAHGCVRDSSTDLSRTGSHLYNWLVNFYSSVAD